MIIFNDSLQRIQFDGSMAGLSWQMPQFPLLGIPEQHWRLIASDWDSSGGIKVGTLVFAEGPVKLTVSLRIYPDSGIARIRYSLSGARFCGKDGDNKIFYGAIPAEWRHAKEISLGHFDRILHSFIPDERDLTPDSLSGPVSGPIVAASDTAHCFLLAYEHGAQQPDHYLELDMKPHQISVRSVKGNFYDSEEASTYLAPWIQVGIAENENILRHNYRHMMLSLPEPNHPSRMPYVFYNTWHFQEGRKYTDGNSVLQDMNEEFILADIDRAHRIGVEVYVIDTGWYSKTGEWVVNRERFPSCMKLVRERLDSYGMKLGLWFNPIAAAASSGIVQRHPEYIIEHQGEKKYLGKIWETEESWGVCLDSIYSDWLAQEMIRVYRELGVRYFKWDAVDQYGCDAFGHGHGGSENSRQERQDCYAYRMALQMIRVVEKLLEACPDAIVDFDVTEGSRCFGLGFLSVGKYFLINNGPYYSNFDIPENYLRSPDTINVFFFPGSARAQVCRQGIRYDPWIPSVLFLTHYLPHGNLLSAHNNQAAFALGGNGIWGYLEKMDDEVIRSWQEFMALYKQTRIHITAADPVFCGSIGTSPEIVEKIDAGQGCICFFTHAGGNFHYRTAHRVLSHVTGSDDYTILPDGRCDITVSLQNDDARIVFFSE